MHFMQQELACCCIYEINKQSYSKYGCSQGSRYLILGVDV